MEVTTAVIIICGFMCLSIWALYTDKKAREAQYKKFLKDIEDLFYSTMNEKEEE